VLYPLLHIQLKRTFLCISTKIPSRLGIIMQSLNLQDGVKNFGIVESEFTNVKYVY